MALVAPAMKSAHVRTGPAAYLSDCIVCFAGVADTRLLVFCVATRRYAGRATAFVSERQGKLACACSASVRFGCGGVDMDQIYE